MTKRRWELLIYPKLKHWFLRIGRLGKYKPFAWEAWIGPVCFLYWADPRSVGSVSKPVRLVR